MNDFLTLDLQLFAEDDSSDDSTDSASTNVTDNDTHTDNTSDNGSDSDANTADDKATSGYYDEINKALGISDETKAEVLRANGLNPDEYAPENETSAKDTETPPPDTHPPEVQRQENTAPPNYEQLYKEKLAELEELKKQQAQPQPNTAKPQQQSSANKPTVRQQTFIPSAIPPMKITPEMIDAVTPLIQDKALQMSGLKKEELDGLEYAEDGEKKQQMFNAAMALARNQVMSDLNNRYVQMQQEKQQQIYERQESARGVQALVKRIEAVPNYEKISQYVTSDYISTLPPMEQATIRQAYYRADRGIGSYADNMILENFWNSGVAAYNKKAGTVSPTATQMTNSGASTKVDMINQNMNRKNQMPRVNQVQSAGTGDPTAWTLDRLEKALASDEGFSSIPDAIKKNIMYKGQI